VFLYLEVEISLRYKMKFLIFTFDTRLPYIRGLLILFMKIHLGIERDVDMDGVGNGWDKLSVCVGRNSKVPS